MKFLNHYRRFLFLLAMLSAATFVSAQNNVPLDTIPFEIGADNRIYVETIVNNDTTRIYRFLVDTGASSCILNSNIESLMTLVRFKETARNIGATSVEDDIPMTSPTQTLQIGHNAVTGLEFVAIPYPVDAWDGVIGLSFLMNFEVVLDYNRWEMYLYKKGSYKADNHAKGYPIKFIQNVPTIGIKASINGMEYALQVETDTGSDRILDLNTPFVSNHQLAGTLKPFATSKVQGTSEEQIRIENVFFDSVEIAGYSLPRFPGGFANAKNGLLASEKMDGVIGNNLLQRFNQVWDFSNSTLYLTANNRFYSPFYGFLLQKRKK